METWQVCNSPHVVWPENLTMIQRDRGAKKKYKNVEHSTTKGKENYTK